MSDAKPEGQGTASQPEGQGTQAAKETSGGKTFTSEETAALLKENMEFKKKLKALDTEREQREKASLESQGKFKELAEAAQKKADEAYARLKRTELKALALQKGIQNTDFINFLDISAVQYDEATGQINGADGILAAFSSAMPPAAGKTASPTGRGVPGGPATWDEYQKMPPDQRYKWAKDHPQEFDLIAKKAKGA